MQGVNQRRFVHHRATRDVHQNRAFLHQLQFALADQVFGFLAQWHHQADEVSLGQQLIQRAELCAQLLLKFRLAAVAAVQNRHAETQAATTGNGGTDIAHADDTQGFAVHIGAEQGWPYAGFPFTGLGPGVQLCHAASGAHDQGKTQVGGAFGQHVRGVGEHQPALVEVIDVVIVVTHRHAGHHFKVLGVFQLLATQLAANADQAMGVGQGFLKLSIDIAQLGIRHDDVEILSQALDHCWRDAAEGKYGFLGIRKTHRYKARRLSGM